MSFSFGAPSSAPATTGLTGGFSFGANKPASTSFGLPSTSQPSTGLFGTPATSTPAFGSGTSTFGATPAFGATTSAPSFGAGTAFGATSTAPAFGSTPAPTFGAASAAPAFGATSAAPTFGAPSLSFGASSAAPTFGSTTTPAFGANTSFGTGLGTGGLNFGAGTNTSASTGLSFGTTTTSSAGLGGLGGFGFGTSTTQSGLGLFASSAAATSTSFATPSLGLGGSTQVGGTTNTTTADGKTEPPKQTKLPNEITTTVESFKEFVKKQKCLSSDVMRVSIKPLHKVARDVETTLRAVVSLRGECGRARAHSRRLRAAAAAALAAAETAARDPPGSELEGMVPPAYVKELISELEQQLITFRRQMDIADKQMQASPKLLTEQELTLGIRRMHESLVGLAARLQAAHAQVQAQKEQYLNLRKYVLKDPTDVFDTNNESAISSLDQILGDAEGSKKKLKTNSSEVGSAVLSDPRAALGNIPSLAGPSPFTYFGSMLSSFSTVDNSAPSWQPQPQASNLNTSLNASGFNTASDSFQLQKPPGKRGKQ
ncbi:nuclear pore complex protein Nup58-like [Aricia agestis]|uniref:nuclear pore complex protein Nup58-like n=1 Tax=Aricia agestis TaxID=91739 RepID=UPI001C208219|nr:nuclear pore complex protein Nup58-like [Aricia agestis]